MHLTAWLYSWLYADRIANLSDFHLQNATGSFPKIKLVGDLKDVLAMNQGA
jgi:hypothetical protein